MTKGTYVSHTATNSLSPRDVGSLVVCMDSQSLEPIKGVIIKVLPESEWRIAFGLPVYKVLTSRGVILQYTEAAVRDIDKCR
jgi:hypothetical protein